MLVLEMSEVDIVAHSVLHISLWLRSQVGIDIYLRHFGFELPLNGELQTRLAVLWIDLLCVGKGGKAFAHRRIKAHGSCFLLSMQSSISFKNAPILIEHPFNHLNRVHRVV